MYGRWGACGSRITSLTLHSCRAQRKISLTTYLVGDRIYLDKDLSGMKIVKVALCIPHEGMTGCEAYTNRLSMYKHLGHLEERGFIEELLLKASPEVHKKVMDEYWSKREPEIVRHSLGKRFEFYHISVGRVLTPFAREEMAKRAEAAGMDYMFMIDDDMTSPLDVFEQLYSNHVDIVAPLAFTRGFPHKPVLYSCEEGWDHMAQKDYFINHTVMNYPKDQLVECDAVGFGAVLIKMEVIRAVDKPRFMSTCGTGEDIYFCYLAKKKGFRVFMDTRVKLGHVGHPPIITEDYVEMIRKQSRMEVEKHYGKIKEYNKKEPLLLLGD